MRALLVIVGLAALGIAGPSAAADCGTIVGWVGVPLCQDAAAPTAPMSNVIGAASSAAADTTLEGDGFDLGGVTARCSDEALDEVVGQSVGPGVETPLGTLVDVLTSNGVECPNTGRVGVRLRGMRLPGI